MIPPLVAVALLLLDRRYSRSISYFLLDRFTGNQHSFDRLCQANDFLP